MRVNARRRKNHIHRLKRNNGWVTGHEEKDKIIYDHFKASMGRGTLVAMTSIGRISFFPLRIYTRLVTPSPRKRSRWPSLTCPATKPRGRMASPGSFLRDVGRQ
jgi:hypothetical protein